MCFSIVFFSICVDTMNKFMVNINICYVHVFILSIMMAYHLIILCVFDEHESLLLVIVVYFIV